MKLKSLLTGAAAAALLTGAASAYTVVFTDTGLPGAPFSASGDEVTAGTFLAPNGLAAELDFSNGVDATFHVYVEQTADGIFTTDDVLVTVNLTNGEFESPVGPLNLDSACSSGASLSSDGGAGDTTATFLISGIDGCDFTSSPPTPGAALGFALPIEVDGAGALGIEIEIVTDSGQTPVDGGSASIGALNIAPAFSVDIDPQDPNAVASLGSTPIYTGFVGTDDLGDIDIDCDTNLFVDLAATPIDCTDATQIDGVVITVFGDFSSAFDSASASDYSTVDGVVAANEQSAEYDITGIIGAAGIDNDIDLDPDGGVINPSTYTATVDIDLVQPLFASDVSVSGDLGPITREGTEVVFAWTPGTAVAAANGSSNVLRLGNLTANAGRVFVEVLNNSDATFVNPGIVQLADLPATGERVYTSESLTTAIGDDWGRGDVRFTIELLEDTVTARRFVRDQTGALTELGAGNVDEQLDNF